MSHAHLNVRLSSEAKPERVPLEGSRYQLGRTAGCELQIADERVSRLHAMFELRDGTWGIEDLGSNNGTLLNGQRLEPRIWTPLRSGDWLRVAREVADIEFVHAEPPVSAVHLSTDALDDGKTVWSDPDQVWLDSEAELAVEVGGGEVRPDLEGQIVRLRERAARQAEHLRLLGDFSRSLGAEFSLDEVYDRCFDLLLETTPADRILVLRLAEDGERLEPLLRCRPGRERLRDVAVSETIVRQAISRRKSVLWSKDLEDETGTPRSLVTHGIHSVLCAPLLGRTAVLGALYVDRQSPAQKLDLPHLEMLNAIAGPTAIAIDNVLSFERLRRAEATRLSYGRFLPPHLVERLQADPDSIRLGGVNQEISILFSDIRGFTRLAERQDPERVVALLNRYFSDMAQVVFQHGGTLDKFLGDGLMALFGAPEARPDDTWHAVRAAIDMQQRMEQLRRTVPELRRDEVEIGIGINTGIATVGFLGTEQRTDYTAIGDAVNVAARLESMAGPGQILISGDTARALGSQARGKEIELRRLGHKTLEGRTGEIELVEVLWSDDFGITR